MILKNNVIKIENIRTLGFINEKDLLDAYETVKENASGFIMIYRDKNNHCYYIHSSGLTKADGVFSSQVLRDLSMYGPDGENIDDEPDGGDKLCATG